MRFKLNSVATTAEGIIFDVTALDALPPDVGPDPDDEGEGHEVTTELLGAKQREVLKRLFAEGHPWALAVQEAADSSPYADFGQWDTLVYLGTGNEAYARQAIAQNKAALPIVPWGLDFTREYYTALALHYHWLRPAMTDEEAAEYRDRMFAWADYSFAPVGSGKGTRKGDSDQITGVEPALRLVARFTSQEDPERSAAILANPQLVMMREEIRRYCELAKGGEWVESSEYNLGTLQLLLTGAYAVGIDQYPEVKALLPQIAEQQRWSITPDFKDAVDWGDVQQRGLHLNDRVALNAMLAGLTGDPQSRALVHELTKGKQPNEYRFLLYRALWAFDPTVPAESYVHPVGFRTTNVGLSIERGPEHVCQIFAPIWLGVDHEGVNVPSVRLWHRGEWAVDDVSAYEPSSACRNTALMMGLGRSPYASFETIERLSAEKTDYGCRVVSRMAGRTTNWRGDHHRPPTFLDDWTRTTDFYRPSKIIVTDAFKGRRPESLDAYAATEQDRMRITLALWQQVWHCPVEPARIDGGYEWQTAGGQTVRLTSDCPRFKVLKTVNGENGISGYFNGPLTGYQVRFLSDEPTAEIRTVVEVTQ